MTWAQKEYQKRVFEILNANGTLAGKVFDRAPDATPFPYIEIEDGDTWTDRGSHATEGWESDLHVHVWTQGLGKSALYDLMEIVDGLLHKVDLGAAGWCDLSFRRDFSTIIAEDDNITHHGIIRYKLLTGEN